MIAIPHKFLTLTGLVLVSTLLVALICGCTGKPEQGPFVVENLTIQPAEAQPDEPVTITVSVTNTHDTWGIYNLTLKINGAKEAEKQADLDAGSSQDVNFSVTRKEPGSHAVFVNGLSGSFTVVEPR